MRKLSFSKIFTLRLDKAQEEALNKIKEHYSIDNDTDMIRHLILQKMVEIALDT